MIRTIALAVALASVLAACADAPPADTACVAFKIISYDGDLDSEPTKAEVKEHNAAWRRICAR